MKRIILIGSICLAMTACIKELGFKEVKVSNATPTFAAPLINTDFSMDDIVKIRAVGSYIELNSSGFLSLIYEKKDYSVFSSSWILIPDQSFNQSMSLSPANLAFINAAPNGTSVTESYSMPLNYNFSPVEVDEILFKGGNLSLSIANNYNQNTMAILTIPELTKGGVAYKDTLFMNPFSSASTTLAMKDYLGDFTGGVVGQWNRMNLNFTFMLTKNLGALAGSGFDLNMGCNAMVFNTIKGYFGQQNISVPLGEIDINIFDNNSGGGTVNFQDPKIKLDIRNQLGVPAQITNISPFIATYKDNTTANITGLSFPIQIAPAPAFNTPSKTVILLDKNNSNFPAIVNNRPVKVTYQGSFQSNPQGKTATRNFSTDTSQVLIDGRVEFPLWGYAKDFAIADTFDLKLEADSDRIVDWALIRLNVTNGFPVEISTQGYFYDTITQTVVDSLFATPSLQQIIPGAQVDGSANVIGATNRITDITITGDRYRLLMARNGRKLILSVKATTSQNGGVIVKFFPNMRVNFKVGAKVKLTGNLPK